MKIGMDARPLSTPMSGVGRLLHETLLAFPRTKNLEFFLFSHKPIHESHSKLLESGNIHWRQGEGFLSKKGGLYYNIQLPLYLKKFPLDLFWGSQQVLPPFLPQDLPAVLTYCDLVLYLYPNTMRPIARLQQHLFQSYSVRRSSHILSISQNTQDDMIAKFNYPKEQASVAYPGIDGKEIERLLKLDASERIQSLGKNYILSVSTIEPRKNYSFLLRVFRCLRELNKKSKIKNLKWVIAGKKGWETEDFFKELKFDSEKYKDIFLLENLNDSELHHLYKNSSLFWMASHYEGFGIPLLESLYHKKMAIVSQIPTFEEIGKKGIDYIPVATAFDAQTWAERSLYHLLRKSTFKGSIKKFTWKASAEQTLKIFQNTVSKEKI
ncbi:MAG: glycosyltransferase family 4 protein [Leptospiraceae bacterium]|nr:glycosyltransferase family 4 protein [Leptospiraceae bacterium]